MQVQETQTKHYHTVSLGNAVTRVPSEDVEFIWSQVAPLLEKALDETYSIKDILYGLLMIVCNYLLVGIIIELKVLL